VKTAKAAKNARPLLLSIGQDWDRHYGSTAIAVRMSEVCPVFSGLLGDLGGSSLQFELNKNVSGETAFYKGEQR